MKKLALAIGLGAYIVFGASTGALAAYRVDTAAGVASSRDIARIAWSETATNARLLFLNEALYPAATGSAQTAITSHGEQERADMARPDTSRTDSERLRCNGDICLVP